MLTTERQQEIVSLLNQKKNVSVSQLCQRLYASPATIRRDLAMLEKNGLLTRTHGGAVLVEARDKEQPMLTRMGRNEHAKAIIGQTAALYVKNGDIIFIDAGSTAYAAVPALSPFSLLTVLTIGLHSALDLAQNTSFDVFMPPGNVNKFTCAVGGVDSLEFLSRFNVDVALFSCAGISRISGVTDRDMYQSRMKQAVLKNAKTKILLCDTSKFNLTYFSKTCTLDDFDYAICETSPGEEWLKFFESSPCELIIADEVLEYTEE